MTHLSTGPHLLAVQLHSEPPIPGKAVQQGRWEIIVLPAKDVGHDGP